MWHRRLGHPSRQVELFLPEFRSYSGNKDISDVHEHCGVFLRAKQTRNVFPLSENKVKDIFYLIHCYIWVLILLVQVMVLTIFLLYIVDDCSRAVLVYLMSDKSEVPHLIKSYCAMVKTQFHKHVKILRSDNGLEFLCIKTFLC